MKQSTLAALAAAALGAGSVTAQSLPPATTASSFARTLGGRGIRPWGIPSSPG